VAERTGTPAGRAIINPPEVSPLQNSHVHCAEDDVIALSLSLALQ
jgi:hypothetical protein